MMIDFDQKSKSKHLLISNSILFFAGSIFKHEFIHLRREGARKSIEEIK